jgi:glycosyltransferase involved in cell wall biosynthesis
VEICRKLEQKGNTCAVAYGRWKNDYNGIYTVRIGTGLSSNIHGIMTRLFDLNGFGSKRATKKFVEWIKEYNPDVIWLHNIHGYYINIEVLFDYLRTCNKEIRWTLHDCWAFTGHCTYFTVAKCNQWKKICLYCSQLKCYPKCIGFSDVKTNYLRKKEAFTGIPNMHLITPSDWLAGLVKQSFLKEYTVQTIHNKIDTKVFKPTESEFRIAYNVTDKFMILGVASKWEKRKGLSDFVALSRILDDRFRIVLVGLNKEQIKSLPKNVIGINRTENNEELASIYSAADVFVSTSYEENYPTVNLEAQACGTRLIAYDVGGTKETIIRNDSVLLHAGDIDGIKQTIISQYEENPTS